MNFTHGIDFIFRLRTTINKAYKNDQNLHKTIAYSDSQPDWAAY